MVTQLFQGVSTETQNHAALALLGTLAKFYDKAQMEQPSGET